MKNKILLALAVIILAPAMTACAQTPTTTPDPNDMYCEHWDSAHKTVFLDKQQGQTLIGDDPDSALFVIYETPAQHDHGLPTGSCGVRMVIFQKTASGGLTQTGRWENLEAGMTFGPIQGSHHCYMRVMGGGDEENAPYLDANYIIDSTGNTTAVNLPGSIESAVWVTQDGKELFWKMMDDHIEMITPDGKMVWTQPGKSDSWKECFSKDKLYAFRLCGDSGKDQIAVIYSQDGKNTWRFQLPLSEVKGHKEVLGFDEKGILILRVDRKIYRVDHEGKAVLAAVWPIYKRRHNSLETIGANKDYDVNSFPDYTHLYEFATNVEMASDHPRPKLEFNINTFEARESMDEGKTWHPISLKPEEAASEK